MLRRLGIALVSACALVGAAGTARGFPQLQLRPGGTPFEGPTDAEVTALWWNPAALAQQRGFRLLASGQLALFRGSVARDAICTATGRSDSCGDRAFPEVPISDLGWGAFAGASWDFRTDNLAIGLGVALPWETHRRFGAADSAAPGSGELPVAYHLRQQDFRILYITLGLGVKVNQKFSIGVGAGVVDSWATLSFDRDTALDGGSARVSAAGGYERPGAASQVSAQVDGGNFLSVIPSPTGLGLSVGATYEPVGWLSLGASWSRMFPFYGQEGRFALTRAVGSTVYPSALQGPLCGETNGARDPCRGGATLIFDIPDVWHLGARVALTPTVELSTWGRAVIYGPYGTGLPSDHGLVLELSGAPVEKGAAPARTVLARSLGPAFAGEVGVRWWVLPSDAKARRTTALRLGASLIAESPAVPADHVNAAALDGPKIDAMVAAELHLGWFRVMAGYQITSLLFSSLNATTPGAFDPAAATRCADASYGLDACADALAGRALPSSAGRYALTSHRFSLALGKDF